MENRINSMCDSSSLVKDYPYLVDFLSESLEEQYNLTNLNRIGRVSGRDLTFSTSYDSILRLVDLVHWEEGNY